MSNHLANTHSPYLMQHQHNPVDWYPWSEEAFEKARREDKPIFLSIGYSTCHWCHVMAHESFEDEAVARLLNRDYVSIKVDREERPDVDAVYMQVCQALTGTGGWPLTIFMTPDQIEDEIQHVIDLFDEVYSTFGLSYHAELSTRPDDSMGSDEIWEKATAALRNALEHRGLDYVVNEGDGAFYGPKIDFHLKDSIGRTWQCGTIQLDMLMPEKFDMHYVGADGELHRPVMLHRVVYGSLERFIGILIENYAGAFPVWLAPVQAKILPITDKHHDYAYDIKKKMFDLGLRVEVDARNEKMGYKVREAQVKKVPYALVVGDQEVADGTVNVRKYGEKESTTMKVEEFIAMLQDKIATKAEKY